jgi:hypothetical protein
VVVLLIPVPFLAQLVTFVLAHGRPGYPLAALLTLLATIVLGIGLYYVFSGEGTRVPFTTTTRHLWSVRFGLILGLCVLTLVHYLLTPPGTIWNPLSVFPLLAGLVGTVFFGMGGLYWGRLYLLAVSYMLLAILMSLWLHWAPLVFGAVTSLTIALLAWAIVRVSRERAQMEGKEPGQTSIIPRQSP